MHEGVVWSVAGGTGDDVQGGNVAQVNVAFAWGFCTGVILYGGILYKGDFALRYFFAWAFCMGWGLHRGFARDSLHGGWGVYWQWWVNFASI